jgi:FtsH-binding integral membrane protein
MLLLSFLHWPYGYYVLLRIIVTGCAGYLAFIDYKEKEAITLFSVLLGFFAILFNPLIPIYFKKSIWVDIDYLAAVIFGLHAFISHKNHKES